MKLTRRKRREIRRAAVSAQHILDAMDEFDNVMHRTRQTLLLWWEPLSDQPLNTYVFNSFKSAHDGLSDAYGVAAQKLRGLTELADAVAPKGTT